MLTDTVTIVCTQQLPDDTFLFSIPRSLSATLVLHMGTDLHRRANQRQLANALIKNESNRDLDNGLDHGHLELPRVLEIVGADRTFSL